MTADDLAGGWNHNTHHHRLLLDAVGSGRQRALDVGCGDGLLTRQLAGRVAEVTAIDLDPACVAATRARVESLAGVMVIEGDVLTHPFATGSFDTVVSVATLHHLDLEAGLVRLAELVAPGGVLGIVGLARTRGLWDLGHDAVGVVGHRIGRRRHGYWEHSAPVVEPTTSYTQVLRAAAVLLPGCRYRRHPLFRYSITWTRPVHG